MSTPPDRWIVLFSLIFTTLLLKSFKYWRTVLLTAGDRFKRGCINGIRACKSYTISLIGLLRLNVMIPTIYRIFIDIMWALIRKSKWIFCQWISKRYNRWTLHSKVNSYTTFNTILTITCPDGYPVIQAYILLAAWIFLILPDIIPCLIIRATLKYVVKWECIMS